ncbi:MAG: hypothetical protein HS111_23425 [Kofleriaceae bacterium]|nr:hypothetical protein [Kofleriaceae bacterium]
MLASAASIAVARACEASGGGPRGTGVCAPWPAGPTARTPDRRRRPGRRQPVGAAPRRGAAPLAIAIVLGAWCQRRCDECSATLDELRATHRTLLAGRRVSARARSAVDATAAATARPRARRHAHHAPRRARAAGRDEASRRDARRRLPDASRWFDPPPMAGAKRVDRAARTLRGHQARARCNTAPLRAARRIRPTRAPGFAPARLSRRRRASRDRRLGAGAFSELCAPRTPPWRRRLQ